VGAVACGAIIACSFSTNHTAIDGNMNDTPMPPPDAGPCVMQSAECFGDVLRTCSGSGVLPVDTTCGWGCGSSGSPHCLQIVPAGGAVMPGDVGLGSDALMDTALVSGNTIINSDDGTIKLGATTLRSAGTGVIAGIDFELRGANAAMFRFKSLMLVGTVYLRGHRAVALVADGAVDVGAIVDAHGSCAGSAGGPGGFNGGTDGSTGLGDGGGSGSDGQSQGGGGGGYGGRGGDGGNGNDSNSPILGGSASGSDAILVLVGGAGGGGAGAGGGGQNGIGGGGGGALQIVSNMRITIANDGGVNAGGCGGRSGGGGNDGGGGGGAGGTILLEAPTVQILGALAVNGGGGGGGAAGNQLPGGNGSLDRNPALGAAGNAVGGIGGAANMLDGMAGGTTGGKGGGGGGGVGRIRFNTRGGSASIDAAAVLSPALDDQPTTCTQGSATLQ
jgi:hypothetical protein